MSDIIFLNGNYLEKENATISIMDRGFLFGDGVYELIPVYKGKPFLIDKHLSRLRSSLSLIGMKSDHEHIENLYEILLELIKKNGYQDHFFYVQITRGFQASRNHVYQEDVTPTILVMGEKYQIFPREKLSLGFNGCLQEDFRWTKSNIKSISLLGNVMLKNYASQNGFYETLLIRDEKLTEGSASNVFISKGQQVMTPNLGPDLLPGVTRDLLIDLLKQNGVEIKECDISREDLIDSDEVWCTSSTNYCVPIVEIDGKTIGSGKVGGNSFKSYDLITEFISSL